MMKSEFPSQRITGDNKPPKFRRRPGPGHARDPKQCRATVAETSAGITVGSPVVATDENGDATLTSADGGTDGDSASFSIDENGSARNG